MNNSTKKNIFTKKNQKKEVLALLIKLLVIASMVAYILLPWQQEIYNISMYLDSTVMSIYYIVIASTINQILMFAVKKFRFKMARTQTVATLIYSLCRYFIGVVLIIAILMEYFGYNYMTELIAGLGVLALVIGLGCQSLINDIVAGIFMVFEGNYQVGDVVVINGWRGTVKEIGLRTTVIEDIGGNLKIINNSSISEIVNNSQVLSIAICTVGIEYEESLERVEKVIDKNLDNIRNNIPEIIEGPFYRGVNTLGASSVELMIVAKCHEDDKFQVQRYLNRQIKLIFDKNNIEIPFTQVTVSDKKKTPKANPIVIKEGVKTKAVKPQETAVKTKETSKSKTVADKPKSTPTKAKTATTSLKSAPTKAKTATTTTTKKGK